ncbi:VanZ family protein [Halorubrum xinjiangense]|uniref:VanZ family protein n=1 Tax=Halorubrum xinjiangense TaxID=261291 RepID=UPI003C6FB791
MTDRDERTRATGRGPEPTGRSSEPTGRDRRRALGFALVVFVGSVVPVPASSGGGGGALGSALGALLDALPAGVGLTDPFHLVGYAVLAALLVPATRERRFGPLLAVTGAVAFGFGIELVQAPIPWRSFAWRDAAVNAGGAVIGAGIAAVRGRGPASTSDSDAGS